MQYTPRSREEADTTRLLAKGEGQFEIIKAEETLSKSNCPMIALTLKVWDINGKQGLVNDWILLNETWDWKLRYLADAVGLTDKYESQQLTCFDLINKSGVLNIGVKTDKEGKYKPQNNVAEYITIKNVTNNQSEKAPVTESTIDDDDIPF